MRISYTCILYIDTRLINGSTEMQGALRSNNHIR
jgi:hypothetical protein